MKALSIAGNARMDILKAALSAGKVGAHIAPSLSMVEIAIATLKASASQDAPFVLSKGHGALGYYAAMHQLGMITDEQFASFESNGGEFPGQPSRTENNNVCYSGGSLGMGLSYGLGLALANRDSNVYVILGDGELNEGSAWEAAALANRLKLSNLIAIVDNNNFQSDGSCEDVLGMNLERIWDSYGWNTVICDGHDIDKLEQVLENDFSQPTVILAQTTKGKGVSFMENNNAWHHSELTLSDYERACEDIGEAYGLY